MAEIGSYKKDILAIFQMELPFDKLCGCNILVTGATGLIGGCLVEALMLNPSRDYAVYACGRNIERAKKRFAEFFEDTSFHFIQHDVTTPFISEVHFDYIIHAASNASPNFFANHPVEVMKSNLYGVANLMDYGLMHGLKRFLYVSSGEVYGEGDGREFTEDYSGYVDPISPRSCYPSAKRAAETLCVSYAAEYGVDVVIARPCHIYGPYFTESDNRVYAQFIRNVLNDEDIVLKSTGEQYRSWCYVVDCVSALFHILLKGDCGQAYNIADNTSNIPIKELARLIATIGGRNIIFEIPEESEKKGYNVVTQSVFSLEKIKSLGWKTIGSLKGKLISSIINTRNYYLYEKNNLDR